MVDWNSALAYPTLKIVRVRDWRLGALKYCLMLLVLLYIIIYALYLEKGYLNIETPVGTVSTSLMRPKHAAVSASQFPYCNSSSNLDNGHPDRLECQVWPANKILYPTAADSSMFITTRVSQTMFSTDPACTRDFTDKNTTCKGFADKLGHSGRQYYMAGVEDYTIKVTQAMQDVKHYDETHDKKYSVEGAVMNGYLVDSHGKKIARFPANTPAIMTLSTILQAADTKLSQPLKTHGGGTYAGETMRHAGIVLLFIIKYDNTKSAGGLPEFKFYVNRIHEAEAKMVEVIERNDTHWMERDRHGVKIVFLQSGTIGRFNFQTLLIALVSSMALLSVATIVVDLTMLYCCTESGRYSEHKYDETEDFEQFNLL